LAVLLPVCQRVIIPWAARIPPEVTYGTALLLTADAVVSGFLLRAEGDPTVLEWKTVLS